MTLEARLEEAAFWEEDFCLNCLEVVERGDEEGCGCEHPCCVPSRTALRFFQAAQSENVF